LALFDESNDDILILFDDTLLGSAVNGFILTLKGIYYHNEHIIRDPYTGVSSEMQAFISWENVNKH